MKNFKNILRTESTVEKGQGTFSGQHSTQEDKLVAQLIAI